MFSRSDRIPTCDIQTQADAQTQGYRIYLASIASRSKNMPQFERMFFTASSWEVGIWR